MLERTASRFSLVILHKRKFHLFLLAVCQKKQCNETLGDSSHASNIIAVCLCGSDPTSLHGERLTGTALQ